MLDHKSIYKGLGAQA